MTTSSLDSIIKTLKDMASDNKMLTEKLSLLTDEVAGLSVKLDTVLGLAGTKTPQRKKSSVQVSTLKKPTKPKKAPAKPKKGKKPASDDTNVDSKTTVATKLSDDKDLQKHMTNIKTFIKYLFLNRKQDIYDTVDETQVNKYLDNKKDSWKDISNADKQESKKADIFYSELSEGQKNSFRVLMKTVKSDNEKNTRKDVERDSAGSDSSDSGTDSD